MVPLDPELLFLGTLYSLATLIHKAERLVSSITGIVLLLVLVPVLLVFLLEIVTYLGSLVLASFPHACIDSCPTRLLEHVQVVVKHSVSLKLDPTPPYLKMLGHMTFPKFVQMTLNVSEDDRFS